MEIKKKPLPGSTEPIATVRIDCPLSGWIPDSTQSETTPASQTSYAASACRHSDVFRPQRLGKHLFLCRPFSWTLFRANSCALVPRGFGFPGSSQTTRLPPIKQPLHLGSSGLSLFGFPRKIGQKKRGNSWPFQRAIIRTRPFRKLHSSVSKRLSPMDRVWRVLLAKNQHSVQHLAPSRRFEAGTRRASGDRSKLPKLLQ